jgi:hypothetical protein
MNQALASKVTMSIAGGNVPRRSRLYRAALIRAAPRALNSLPSLSPQRNSSRNRPARKYRSIASLKSGLRLLIARTAVKGEGQNGHRVLGTFGSVESHHPKTWTSCLA